ncbi:MAG: gamma-glutamyltransferase [Pseudomonadota bacterium]
MMPHRLFVSIIVVSLIACPARSATRDPARSDKAMVATAHPLATEAALQILRKGGNAADAAAAAALAISVVEPYSAGIGGGGFALVHDKAKGQTRALDFRERAPLAAHRDLYLDGKGQVIDDASVTGHRAAAVPGTLAGLEALVREHGTQSLAEVAAPAIDLAQNGFVVTPHFRHAVISRLDDLKKDPGARDAFLVDGKPPEVGNLLLQRDLASTLRLVAKQGSKAFYSGELAQAVVADMAENGGLITAQDLKSYQPSWREPARLRYRGHDVLTMPLPSSAGVVLAEVLGLLERDATSTRPYHDLRSLHVYIEACRRAYADRARDLGDPAFLRGSIAGLTTSQRLDAQYRSIQSQARTPSEQLGVVGTPPLKDRPHTTHLIVVDSKGNAVSMTFTVNTVFGAAVVVPGTGILLNNEMDDFSVKPGTPNSYGLVGAEANAIAPAKIPLSSMAPTLVFEGSRLKLVIGSPGGSTIPTTVIQILVHVLDDRMNVEQAVAAPRVHHQWLPDLVHVEPNGLDPETRRALTAYGHTLVEREPWGNAMAVQLFEDGHLEGAADPRGEGVARGL